AVYTDGATKYNFQNLFPQTMAMYGGTGLPGVYQSLAVAGVADGAYVGTTAAGAAALAAAGLGTAGIETVKSWGFRGGYTHNWDAYWASAIYGAYAQLKYGAATKAGICANNLVLVGMP